jgi:membrane dipeptidase
MMEKHEREWSRRKFITTLTGAGAVMILNPIFSWAADETDPRTAGIVARTYGIDVHNHIDLYMDLQGPSGTQINLAGLMKRAGLSAICMTFAVDDLPQLRTGEAYEHFENELKTINGILKRNGMKRSLHRRSAYPPLFNQ